LIKIDENIDLSKRVLGIDIDSPVFLCLLQDIDKEIQRCIKKVFEGEFESGEISVKLNIEIPETYKSFPRTNLDGDLINDTYKYRKPDFQHKVTSTLKKKYEQKGGFTGEREVVFEDGEFVARPINREQMTLEDYD
jgi:hypothetical protein